MQLLQPVKKANVGFNLVSTKNFRDYFNINDKDNKGSIKDSYRRTQIEFELLKNPSFRIFIAWENKDLFQGLIDNVRNNKSHFTPYLGLSQFTAQFKFVDVCQAELLQIDDYANVVTAINLGRLKGENPVLFDYESAKYILDTMPVEMQPDRIVTNYADILLETNGNPVRVRLDEIYKTEKYGNISFL